MDTYFVILRPQGSHLGPLTAQTLFGAVCWALATLNMVDVGKVLADFEHQPRFAFSSPFPYLVKDKAAARTPANLVRLYPKPALPSITMEQVQQIAAERPGQFKVNIKRILAEQVKPVQGASYVSEALFAEICAGTWNGSSLVRAVGVNDNPKKQLWAWKGALWTNVDHAAGFSQNDDPRKPWWKIDDVQRNAVDRLLGSTAEGQLFHEAQTFYQRKRAGLWFMACADADAWGWLQAAFRYLQDTGLGGKRAVGKGHFDFDWFPANNVFQPANTDSFIALSPYLPRFAGEQIEALPLRYAVRTIRQKSENKFPGKSQPIYSGGLRLFEPGSVFSAPPGSSLKEIYGRLAHLGTVNGRAVYYNGLALAAPASLGGGK